MKQHVLQLISFFLLFALLLLFTQCKKDNDDNGTNFDDCCSTPHLDGEIGNAKIFIPNIFTPNGDGVNDFFGIHSNGEVQEITTFTVKDKSGKTYFTIHSTQPNNPAFFWDGTDENNVLQAGIFEYEAIVMNTDGVTATFTGDFCSCPCDEDSECKFSELANLSNCRFATQHDGLGGSDGTVFHGEAPCE